MEGRNLPKEFLKNTNDRFTDYCGNPLFALEVNLEAIRTKPDRPDESEIVNAIQRGWQEFFARLQIFINKGFEPDGEITVADLQKLLEYKNKNVFEEGVFEKLKDLYLLISSK